MHLESLNKSISNTMTPIDLLRLDLCGDADLASQLWLYMDASSFIFFLHGSDPDAFSGIHLLHISSSESSRNVPD